MIKQTNSLPTYITFEPLEKIILLLQNKQVAVLVDENTKRDCYPILDKVFEKAKLQKPLLIEMKEDSAMLGEIITVGYVSVHRNPNIFKWVGNLFRKKENKR